MLAEAERLRYEFNQLLQEVLDDAHAIATRYCHQHMGDPPNMDRIQ